MPKQGMWQRIPDTSMALKIFLSLFIFGIEKAPWKGQ
jgi:hypothetical protein